MTDEPLNDVWTLIDHHKCNKKWALFLFSLCVEEVIYFYNQIDIVIKNLFSHSGNANYKVHNYTKYPVFLSPFFSLFKMINQKGSGISEGDSFIVTVPWRLVYKRKEMKLN